MRITFCVLTSNFRSGVYFLFFVFPFTVRTNPFHLFCHAWICLKLSFLFCFAFIRLKKSTPSFRKVAWFLIHSLPHYNSLLWCRYFFNLICQTYIYFHPSALVLIPSLLSLLLFSRCVSSGLFPKFPRCLVWFIPCVSLATNIFSLASVCGRWECVCLWPGQTLDCSGHQLCETVAAWGRESEEGGVGREAREVMLRVWEMETTEIRE